MRRPRRVQRSICAVYLCAAFVAGCSIAMPMRAGRS